MVIKNKAVRVVVAYYNAPPLAKGNNLLKELPAAICAGRHIRIVAPHKLNRIKIYLARIVPSLQILQIGMPIVGLIQRVLNNLSANQF